ncbi:hypothetical protein Hanom_Chr09g00796221 [Helianthus anomalus]
MLNARSTKLVIDYSPELRALQTGLRHNCYRRRWDQRPATHRYCWSKHRQNHSIRLTRVRCR